MRKILLLLVTLALPALPQAEPPYTIHSGDILMIRVWCQPGVSGSVVVRPSGDVYVPKLGLVAAAGLNTTALAERCRQRLTSAGLPQAEVLVQLQTRAKQQNRQAPAERQQPHNVI